MAKVPSIPVDALNSIQDRNAYAVLRAVADILNVRNGQTGDSGSAFVTRAELGNLRGGSSTVVTVPGAQQSQGVTPPYIRPSDIARVINDLQAQVIESPLFKALGERIDRVDAPGTGVIAQLDEERITRATAVSALAQLITTLEATVDDQSIALQTEAQVRADADGNISGKFSVKIDANGYVTGFGLISTANNAAPYSEFMVRADRFSIASPSGPGITPRVPFIVLTTPTTVNGYPVPAGVYMDAAMLRVASIQEAHINFAAIRTAHIQDAAITNAKIGDAQINTAKIQDLAVNTLKIQGQAVTVPASAYIAGTTNYSATGGNTYTDISVGITSSGAPIQVLGTYWGSTTPGNVVNVWLYRDGTVIWAGGVPEYGQVVYMLSDTPPPGFHTYALLMRSSDNNWSTFQRSLLLLETKR